MSWLEFAHVFEASMPNTTRGSFDIAPRTGYWSDGGSKWVEQPGRPADIYIFAWHPVTEEQTADHRDPDQWEFYVVPEAELPPRQKTIALSRLSKHWAPVKIDDLVAKLSEL